MARRQTHPVIHLHSLAVISRGSGHFRLVTTIKRNKIANDINYGLEIGNYQYGGSQGNVRAECPTGGTYTRNATGRSGRANLFGG